MTYADNRTRSATIDDAGDIRSVTDEYSEVTRYGYDALRRLTSITYPANDTVAWYPTTIQYERVGTELGVAGTHWKQTTTTGSARKITHYDQRLRPAVTSEVDIAVPSTQRYVRRGYDYAGRDSVRVVSVGECVDERRNDDDVRRARPRHRHQPDLRTRPADDEHALRRRFPEAVRQCARQDHDDAVPGVRRTGRIVAGRDRRTRERPRRRSVATCSASRRA
ncbi:RHS repeat domain-containing protein [Tahibacter soli]|uniref:RHS repeat protein n=1 Tax=Tahibacter soli TaxID=2983605 RepID=A0A9X3YMF3_9GAMM|nr:RHS repeat domain-containing protein [Tahibacter soli]MDC8014374.1 RHS repeat protein [Tahibacter soli]